MNEYEQNLYNKLINKEEIDEGDISKLVFRNEIYRENGDNRRWVRSVQSIISLGDKYFAVDWDEGLTEMQENEFCNQPYEVKQHTYKKTIEVTEWIRV